MKYRTLLLGIMTGLLAVMVVSRTFKVLASAALLAVALGIYSDRRSTYLEKAHPERAEDDPFYGVWSIFVLAVVAFCAGAVSGLVTKLRWWSIGAGLLAVVLYFAAAYFSNAANSKPKLNQRSVLRIT